jgi:sulfotransferase family protein
VPIRPGHLLTRGARRATARFRALPNFIILGAQGCGTTSLYWWLNEHPQVSPAVAARGNRELHYFDLHYEKGERWYRSQFPLARRTTVTGEETPYLFMHPLAPERVARDLPSSTVLIVMLRDPANRAISRFHRATRQGLETETLERALALEPERIAGAEEAILAGAVRRNHQTLSYVTGGHYATYLRRWRQHVAPERIITLESEAMFRSDTPRNDLLVTLGLEPFDAPFPSRNANKAPQTVDADAAIREQLREYFRPHNEELFELLGRRFWGQ